MEDEYQLLTLVLHDTFSRVIEGGIICNAFFDMWQFRVGSDENEEELRANFRDSYLGREFPELEWETWQDAVNKSREQVRLEPHFGNIPLEILPESREGGDIDDFWSNFYRQHPGASGVFQISRVGFNAARDQALLSIGLQSAGLAGKGHYFFLTRNPEWTIAGYLLAWIS